MDLSGHRLVFFKVRLRFVSPVSIWKLTRRLCARMTNEVYSKVVDEAKKERIL